MEKFAFMTGIIRGEGEVPFIPLLEHLQSETPATSVPSFTYRIGHHIAETEQATPISLAQLPFPYPDLEQEKGRICILNVHAVVLFNVVIVCHPLKKAFVLCLWNKYITA